MERLDSKDNNSSLPSHLSVHLDHTACCSVPNVKPGWRMDPSALEISGPLPPAMTALHRIERVLQSGDSHTWMLAKHVSLDLRTPADVIDDGPEGAQRVMLQIAEDFGVNNDEYPSEELGTITPPQ